MKNVGKSSTAGRQTKNSNCRQRVSSCRAAVFLEAGKPLEIRDVSIPELGRGNALIRITCCTICGSDHHTISGHRPSPTPSILGHETIGIVSAVGSESCYWDGQPLCVGDRVTWSVAASCHQCGQCKAGMPQKCTSLFKYGHERLSADNGPDGGLSEYCLLRPGSTIVQVPPDVSDAAICPASCATATVAAAVRTAGPLEGKRVLIFGAGMLGLTASAFASSGQAQEICVVDTDEARLRKAERFGATRLASFGVPLAEYDVVLEMSGSAAAVSQSIERVSVGGIIVLVGTVSPVGSIEIDPERIVRRLISIHGVHNYRPDDLVSAVHFLAEHHTQFPFTDLVGRTFALSAVADALAYAESDRPIRVAIVPSVVA